MIYKIEYTKEIHGRMVERTEYIKESMIDVIETGLKKIGQDTEGINVHYRQKSTDGSDHVFTKILYDINEIKSV